MSGQVSCNLTYYQNDNAEFKALRNRVFEKAKLLVGTTEQDVVNDILLSNGYSDARQIKYSDFNAYLNSIKYLTRNSERVSISKSIDLTNNTISDLSASLEIKKQQLDSERRSTEKNYSKMQSLQKEIADDEFVIKMLKESNEVLQNESDKTKVVTKAEFSDDLTSKEHDNSVLTFLHNAFDISQIALPMQKAAKNKQIKVNENTFSLFKSFVDYKDRSAYAKGVLNSDVYGRWQGLVMDTQILKNKMDAKLVELSKHIFNSTKIVEDYFNNYLRPYKELTEKEKDQIRQLSYKMIENSKSNSLSTFNWFGTNKKGEHFELPFFQATDGSQIEILTYSNKDIQAHLNGRKSIEKAVIVSNEDLKLIESQTKSVISIQSNKDNHKIVFDRNILLNELLTQVRDKAPILNNFSNELISASLISALEYRKFFQTEGQKLLSDVKKNYEYLADFYEKSGNYVAANKFKLMAKNIGNIGKTYVPRTIDKRFFEQDFLKDFISTAEKYSLQKENKSAFMKLEIQRLATKYQFDDMVVRQMFLSSMIENNINVDKYKLLQQLLEYGKLDSANIETDLEEQMTKLAKLNGFTLNKDTKEFIQTVYSRLKADDDTVLWRNTLSRTNYGGFIPYQTDVLKASVAYVNGGVNKVYKERMKYQYNIHNFQSKKDAVNDKFVYGVDYIADNDRMSEYFKKYISNVTGETNVTSQALLNVINSNSALKSLAKHITSGTVKVVGSEKTKQFIKQNNTSDFSENELKALTGQINRALHLMFLSYTLISPIKNYIGSFKNHFAQQGLNFTSSLGTKELDIGTDQPYDLEKIIEESGVDSFIDYINELNKQITDFPEDRQKSISDSLLKLKQEPTVNNLFSTINQLKETGLNAGSKLFELTEKWARRNAFKSAFIYGVKTLSLDKNAAISYANATVAKIDGIYNATGKALITNGEFGSIWFKYMNYGITQYNWYHQLYQQAEWSDLKDFIREASDESRVKSFVKWLGYSQTPSAVIVRYAMAESFLLSISAITALIFGKAFINLTSTFGNETLRALVSVFQFADSLIDGDDNNERSVNEMNDVIRQVPLGLFNSIILGLVKSGIEQGMYGDKEFKKGTQNRIEQSVLNTITPAGVKPFMYFDYDNPLRAIGKEAQRQSGFRIEYVPKEIQDESLDRMLQVLKHSY